MVLLGTLIETGVGVIHAFNERLATVYSARNQAMPRKLRPVMAIILMVIASLLTKIGLVGLLIVLLLFGLLLVFAQSSAVAPFIYTLF